MSADTASVRISKKLYDEIDRRIKANSLKFESVDKFVEYALSDVIGLESPQELSAEDEETVSKRLRAFGY